MWPRESRNTPHDSDVLSEARRLMLAEAAAVASTAHGLGAEFCRAVDLLVWASRVHVAGVGKSGHIARKIAGTLASTGTPANELHPTDALHGDLGNVEPGHVVVLVSRSGECQETNALLHALTKLHPKAVPLIALTGVPRSTLGHGAWVVIECAADEACPDGLVPTSSTTAALAVGDALANAVRQRRGHSAADFRLTHPGGALGAA